jgi:Cu-Zn family superoxide dismutase
MRMLRSLGTVAGAAVLAASVAGGAFASGAQHATATFVASTGAIVGSARLVEDASGIVHLNVHVSGMAPGLHGIHIHAIGSCTPTFAAAGGHYNPFGEEHGLDNPNGPHAGDLPNLVVNAEGIGHLNATTDRVTLSAGPATLFDATPQAEGSALIIHANQDDQVTDVGNGGSGARIACAVIEAD